MVKMTEEVREFIGKIRPAYLATASKDGTPNIAPKGSLTAIDDETLLYADIVPGKTRENLKEYPKVAVSWADPTTLRGVQIKGTAKSISSGKVYKETCKKIAALPIKFPKPNAAVLIKIEEIFDSAPGKQ
ncbi:MAG: pyridoxamine 5'-phosphate oxidase family protein [Euryarchaeota archaeon]|nr:pyridoxamine 5'-phosphate oxidase family protein [Euryarchaeota archaeon]